MPGAAFQAGAERGGIFNLGVEELRDSGVEEFRNLGIEEFSGEASVAFQSPIP